MKSWWAGKRVMVGGGCGFIGSYLVELLHQDGVRVTVVDDLSRGKVENVSAVLQDIHVIRADLRDPTVCQVVTAGMDVVMNLAAPVCGVGYSRIHNAEMLTSSLLINTPLLEAARLNRASRFLVCSSSCVYPDDAIVPTPEYEGERGTPDSSNEGYGWAKRIGEKQARYYAEEYGMEIAIARPFNAYGPRDYLESEKAHVIPALIRRVLSGEDPLVVWGSGRQTRSFVHALDIARGLKLLTEKYACADPVNIGHDRETSIRQLIERLLALTGRTPKVVCDTSKPEGPVRKSADPTLLQKVTGGFVPNITLDEGLAEMLEFFEKTYFRAPQPF